MQLQTFDRTDWRAPLIAHEELFILLHAHLPPELVDERELFICRLWRALSHPISPEAQEREGISRIPGPYFRTTAPPTLVRRRIGMGTCLIGRRHENVQFRIFFLILGGYFSVCTSNVSI